MQLGMIGLGRMGANMVRRLINGGHECVVFDLSPEAVKELVKEKAIGAVSMADLVEKLAAGQQLPKRVVVEEGVFPQEKAKELLPTRQY